MAFDAFLKLDQVKGESPEKGYQDQIKLQHYSWGLRQPAGGVGHNPSGRAEFDSLTFTKPLDVASPDLAFHCASGTTLKTALLTVCSATGDRQPLFEVSMESCWIGNVVQGASPGDQIPVEQIQLHFGKIKWTYHKRNKDNKAEGKLAQGWNLIEHCAWNG